jgi:hypothetical protein
MFCEDYGPGGGGNDPVFGPFDPQIVISAHDMLEAQRALYTVLAFLDGCTPLDAVVATIEEMID